VHCYSCTEFHLSSRHCGVILGCLVVQRFHGSHTRFWEAAMALVFVVLPQVLAFDNFPVYSLFLYIFPTLSTTHTHTSWVLPPKLFVRIFYGSVAIWGRCNFYIWAPIDAYRAILACLGNFAPLHRRQEFGDIGKSFGVQITSFPLIATVYSPTGGRIFSLKIYRFFTSRRISYYMEFCALSNCLVLISCPTLLFFAWNDSIILPSNMSSNDWGNCS
jgi:hypothetical protein